MLNFRPLKVIIVILILTSVTNLQAENWPNWRGPKGDGTSSETNLPVKWNSTMNVLWKVPITGVGHASPIVWGDKLFTVTAKPETQEKLLLCYDTKNGNLLWQVTVLKTKLENKHNDNSFASGTPATDGTTIYVSFLDGESVVVAAYDFNGKQIWMQRPGTFSSPHGYSCSPVIYKDKVIINADSKGDAFIAALSTKDGRTIWKNKLDKPAHSFSTPLFREMAGRTQMIYCGNQEVSSYNPEDGSRYWFITGPSEDFCSTPVYNEKTGLVLISSAWPQRHLLAIKPDGKGDVSNTHIAWRSTNGAYYVPSPVTVGDYLISTMTSGLVHCIEAATGNILWKENLGKQYSSAVLVNGLVYMPNDEGVITVIKPGPTYEAIAKNAIGEMMFASPAISNGRIYLKGAKHLFCIGVK
ncbi:MAG: PQQ-binding-like beta-propeller repeat protein [Mariniphaga sp.]|nr:PQQ-binding-like beta-propeller repeat protein [Mariniphaga sp.]